jgi:uncharacterized protein DUF4381
LDPLAQLNDIHLPEQINQYPIAIGWWLLAMVAISALIVIAVKTHRYKKLRRDKNIAIKQLQQNPELPVVQVLLLLKWAALAYFPRQDCANLYGEKLQQFLLQTLPENIANKQRTHFIELLSSSKASFDKIYQQDQAELVDEQLYQLALFWLKYALPPVPAKAVTAKKLSEVLS